MMSFPEMMFYAEAGGLLPTRAGRIAAAIKAVKAHPSPEIDLPEFEKILEQCGLRYNDLTDREIRHINASIR